MSDLRIYVTFYWPISLWTLRVLPLLLLPMLLWSSMFAWLSAPLELWVNLWIQLMSCAVILQRCVRVLALLRPLHCLLLSVCLVLIMLMAVKWSFRWLFLCLFVFELGFLCCIPGHPWTHSNPALASWVPEWQACYFAVLVLWYFFLDSQWYWA